jgi:CYTH domain-containing protein
MLDSKSYSRQFDSDKTLKMKKIEIERRFILKKLPILIYAETKWIWQFYIRENGEIVRYRETRTDKITWERIIKRNIGFGQNEEEILSVTSDEFYEASSKLKLSEIHKKRHILTYGKLKYEIDVFDNIHLIIMEIELDDIKQKVGFPFSIRDMIIKEITGVKEFTNFNMGLIKPIEQAYPNLYSGTSGTSGILGNSGT